MKSVKMAFEEGIFGIGGKWIVETQVGDFVERKVFKTHSQALEEYKKEKERLGLLYSH